MLTLAAMVCAALLKSPPPGETSFPNANLVVEPLAGPNREIKGEEGRERTKEDERDTE